MIFTTSHDLGTSEPPYLCSICKRDIHPSEGTLCVVCREKRKAQRAEQHRVRMFLEEHPRLATLYALVKSGVQSDFPSGYPHHGWMQTNPGARKPDQTRWETELAVLLGMMDVQLDDTGHDSPGDWYIGGWWELPGHAA